MEKITTIVTSDSKAHFIVDYDGEKYFLKYVEDEGKQTPQPQTPQVVGYLIKEGGEYYLQEAFFDKLNYEHVLFRSVSRDKLIAKDLGRSVFAACSQIEKTMNNNQRQMKPASYMTGVTKSKWTAIIHALQKGTDLESTVRALQAKINSSEQF